MGPGEPLVTACPRSASARLAAPPATITPKPRVDWTRPRYLTPTGQPAVPFLNDPAWDRRTLLRSAAGDRVYSTVELEGVRARVYSRPVSRNGKIELVVQIAHPLDDLDRVNQEQVYSLLILLPLALLVAGLFGSWMTGRTLRPVRQITEAAARVLAEGGCGAEDLSQRLEVTSRDEFGELAETFNGMIHRLEQAFRRLESAFEQQRRFTADASHELRTPLTMIMAGASLALKAPRTPEEYRKALRVVKRAAEVMNRLVRDLLLLARADAAQLRLEPQPLAVETLFECAAAAVPEGATPPVRFEHPDPALGVVGDLDSLFRLLTNLIENAIRHTPAAGEITVSAHETGGEGVITVTDTGEGIPPEHLPRLCERFYRVDAARGREEGGAGLGLAICRSIAQAHRGRLEIDSQVGHGTTVRVTLPRGPGVELKGRAAAPPIPTPSDTPTARDRGG